MNWNPLSYIRRDPVKARLASAQRELRALQAKRDLDTMERELAQIKYQDAYATATPDVRMRLEAEREVLREEARNRRSAPKVRPNIHIPSEVISLLTAAKQSIGIATNHQAVAVHAQESVLDMMQNLPYGLDTIGEYRNLFQIPTLIRELYPYKATIIRTLPMLDFIRWCCRVVYEEAPVFKGLVKGKLNYICRGMKCKVSPKDTSVDVKTDATLKAAQRAIDRFVDQQDYLAKRKERRRRMLIEGEAFLWLADSRDPAASPTACFVEPDFIRPSQREGTNQEDPHISGGGYGIGQAGDDWSFGIHTAKHQYWKPLGYQIVWNDLEEQKVRVEDMFHTAVRERSNIKRCLPPAFCLLDDMIRLTLLRAALAEASKFRASIGGVIKYEEASAGAVRSWVDTVGGRCLSGTDQPTTIEPVDASNYTNLIHLSPGRDFVKGPDYPDVNSLQAIYDWHTRALAQAEQVPEWMVSGAAAGSSFASSLTSESSSIIEFESEAAIECRYDRDVFKRVLAAEVAKEKLPKDFFDNYEICVEPDSMVSRDVKSETETAIMVVQAGLCSKQTAAAQLGYNLEAEKPLIEQEQAQAIEVAQQNAAAGLGPDGKPLPQQSGAQDDGAKTTDGARGQLEGEEAK